MRKLGRDRDKLKLLQQNSSGNPDQWAFVALHLRAECRENTLVSSPMLFQPRRIRRQSN
jgi:hypothetical protein